MKSRGAQVGQRPSRRPDLNPVPRVVSVGAGQQSLAADGPVDLDWWRVAVDPAGVNQAITRPHRDHLVRRSADGSTIAATRRRRYFPCDVVRPGQVGGRASPVVHLHTGVRQLGRVGVRAVVIVVALVEAGHVAAGQRVLVAGVATVAINPAMGRRTGMVRRQRQHAIGRLVAKPVGVAYIIDPAGRRTVRPGNIFYDRRGIDRHHGYFVTGRAIRNTMMFAWRFGVGRPDDIQQHNHCN